MRRTLRLADPCEERVTCGPEPLEPVKGCQNLPSLAVYFYVSILVDLLDGMYDQTHQQQQYVVHSGYPATTRPTAGACSANIAGLTHRHGCLAPFHRQEVVHHDLKAQKKKKAKIRSTVGATRCSKFLGPGDACMGGGKRAQPRIEITDRAEPNQYPVTRKDEQQARVEEVGPNVACITSWNFAMFPPRSSSRLST